MVKNGGFIGSAVELGGPLGMQDAGAAKRHLEKYKAAILLHNPNVRDGNGSNVL